MAIESIDLCYEYQFNQNASSFKQRASNKVFQSLFTVLVKIGQKILLYRMLFIVYVTSFYYPCVFCSNNLLRKMSKYPE